MRTKLLASFLFISTIISCDSDKESIPTPTQSPAPEPIKTFDFSFRYDTFLEDTKDYELILSDKDGKVLLDTLIAFNTNHSLSVKSENTKYNLTTIFINPTDNSYWMQTYLQVNPDKWRVGYHKGSSTPVLKEKADITYTNFPAANNYYFQTRALTSYLGTRINNTLTIQGYTKLIPTDLAYLLVPTHGKYLFTQITSKQTTVDFSEAADTEKRKYNKPSNVTNYKTRLDGFTKAGDLTSWIPLYSSWAVDSEEFDLQFPPSGIEEFGLEVSYTDAGGYLHTYNYLDKEIPTEIDFATTSDFSVSKSGFEDFAVTFTDDKPNIFHTDWAADETSLNAQWMIYSSPNETSYKPKAFLENLKSKKLAGEDISLFKLLTATSRKFKGHTYQDYLDINANPALSLYNEIKQSRLIRKTY